jgi:hypothetical protein
MGYLKTVIAGEEAFVYLDKNRDLLVADRSMKTALSEINEFIKNILKNCAHVICVEDMDHISSFFSPSYNLHIYRKAAIHLLNKVKQYGYTWEEWWQMPVVHELLLRIDAIFSLSIRERTIKKFIDFEGVEDICRSAFEWRNNTNAPDIVRGYIKDMPAFKSTWKALAANVGVDTKVVHSLVLEQETNIVLRYLAGMALKTKHESLLQSVIPHIPLIDISRIPMHENYLFFSELVSLAKETEALGLREIIHKHLVSELSKECNLHHPMSLLKYGGRSERNLLFRYALLCGETKFIQLLSPYCNSDSKYIYLSSSSEEDTEELNKEDADSSDDSDSSMQVLESDTEYVPAGDSSTSEDDNQADTPLIERHNGGL